MKVAVIGGAGRMGSWFVKYFTNKGLPTIIYDLRTDKAKSLASSTGAKLSALSYEDLGSIDLVLIAIPIEATAQAVAEVVPKMKRGAILAEVSSIKAPIIEAMREASNKGIRSLSLHPLFGPSSEGLKSERIAVIPIADGPLEAELTANLFPEAEIVSADEEEHDRAMAFVLSLTYFVNLAFSGVLRDVDMELVKRLAGTTFTVQMALAESVLGEAPELVASLIRGNPYTERYIDRFLSEMEMIRDSLLGDEQGFLRLFDSLNKCMSRDPDFHLSNERRHRAYRAIRNLN